MLDHYLELWKYVSAKRTYTFPTVV